MLFGNRPINLSHNIICDDLQFFTFCLPCRAAPCRCSLVSGVQPAWINSLTPHQSHWLLPFAIMLLTKDCLQVRQKADGNGVPAYHRGATSVRNHAGRCLVMPECGGKAPTQLLWGHVVGWGYATMYSMWNVHTDATRTNNAAEGWHSRLNRAIGCSDPNTYQLLTVLKTEQATIDLTLARADTGAPPPTQRRKYSDLDARLDRLRGEYRNGQMTTDDYLGALGHLVHHYWGPPDRLRQVTALDFVCENLWLLWKPNDVSLHFFCVDH